MIGQKMPRLPERKFATRTLSPRRLAATALLLTCGAAAPIDVPVTPAHATTAAWSAVAAEEALFLERPERVLAYAATAATTPEQQIAVVENIEAAVQAPSFMRWVEIALALLLALVAIADRRRIAAWFGWFGRAAVSGLIGLARTIVQLAEEPVPQPRRVRAYEPLLRLAEPAPPVAWPAMSRIHDDRWVSARPRFVQDRDAAPRSQVTPPALARYCFYTLNQWGIVDCRTDHSFASDAAAMQHAGRSAGSGQIEVWRNGRKLGTVGSDAAPAGHDVRDYA